MDIVEPRIEEYLSGLLPPRPPVVVEMETLGKQRGFPIVGPLVGQTLELLARSIGARSVFELGSGFGYSAFWFARAVGPGGRVVCTDGSEENAAEARVFLSRAGLGDRVRFVVGDALRIIDREEGPFDILFNDIDKESYPEVFGAATRHLRPGGLLISDNMLWFGNVLSGNPDPRTRGIQELTRRLLASPEFQTVLWPIRDGVTVSRRRLPEELTAPDREGEAPPR